MKVGDAGADLVTSGGLHRHHEDGRREVFPFLTLSARGRFVPAIVMSSITTASRFEVVQRCPEVELALRLFGVSPNWYDLFKVSEIIDHDMGKDGIINEGWCTKFELGRFTGSANNYHATGLQARHAPNGWSPMTKPVMSLGEAEEFIRKLLDNWIRTKVQ